jgi:hypothetical protein
MADVVKMGRPQAKPIAQVAPVVTDRSYAAQYPAMPSSHASKVAVPSETAQSQPQPQPQSPITQVTISDPVPVATSTGTNNNVGHDGSMGDDWTIVDQPPVVTSDYSSGVSSLEGDVDKQYSQVAVSDVQVQVEESEINAQLDDALNNAAVYQSEDHSFDHHEGNLAAA